MHDWNVVATVHEPHFNEARRLLGELAPTAKTDFFNILVMRVPEIPAFLEELKERWSIDPAFAAAVARVVPVTDSFTFQNAEDFEVKARRATREWVPSLAGKSFHVRMHRRGFRGKISSLDEEQFLDEHLLDLLSQTGHPGRITFSDPDAVISVETVGNRAGLSLWTREDLRRYPFLHLD